MPGLFVPTIVKGSRMFGALLLILASAVAPATPCWAASRSAVRGASAMAVTPEDHATRVAVDVLRAGGNAIDGAGRWIGAADPRRGGTARGF